MENKDRERSENMGGLAGLGAGILTGAQVGTVLIPVPFLGTFVGAMAGGVVGTAVGQRVGAAALNGINAFIDSMSAPAGRTPAQGTTQESDPGSSPETI